MSRARLRDADGKHLSQFDGATTVSYEYDDADQLTKINSVVQYQYDFNGNRTNAYGDSFTYSWQNNLKSATVGGTTASYTTNGDGVRTSRTVGGTTTTMLWDQTGGRPQLVTNGTTGIVQGATGSAAEITGTTTSLPVRDGLGSLRLRTSPSGTPLATATWDAWGNPRSLSGTQGSLGWTGELADPTSGLVHLRAREYSPGTSRFTQRDTLQPNAPGTQGYNAYSYANNNPATLIDPSGYFGEAAVAVGTGESGALTQLVMRIVAATTTAEFLGMFVAAIVIAAVIIIAITLLQHELEKYCYSQGNGLLDCVASGAATGCTTASGDVSRAGTAVGGAVEAIPGTVTDLWEHIWDRIWNRPSVPSEGRNTPGNPDPGGVPDLKPKPIELPWLPPDIGGGNDDGDERCPRATTIYHRMEASKQDNITLGKQIASNEIWGLPEGGGGPFCSRQSFSGTSSLGQNRYRVHDGTPADRPGRPLIATWTPTRPFVGLESTDGKTYAKLRCITITRAVFK